MGTKGGKLAGHEIIAERPVYHWYQVLDPGKPDMPGCVGKNARNRLLQHGIPGFKPAMRVTERWKTMEGKAVLSCSATVLLYLWYHTRLSAITPTPPPG